MAKISNVRLPNSVSSQYSAEQFNQMVRSLEQVIFQLNSTYTPTVTENSLSAYSWFDSTGDSCEDAVAELSPTRFDAFGRLRVSNPYTLFDSQNRYQSDPQFSGTTSNGAITYLSNESSVQLKANGGGQPSDVIRQTFRRFPYQPGKSLLVFATFKMEGTQTGLTQRVGFFDSSDGVFFQNTAGTNAFVIRTSTSGSPSDARTVNQADWNTDKLDGTGPSGITLDVTKTQILYIDFEWLGVGSVRCGFVLDGQLVICHIFNNANDQTKVYMKTAILPIRYQITKTAVDASSANLIQICSTVISEGGYGQKSIPLWVRRTAIVPVSTVIIPIITIRLKSSSAGAVVIPGEVVAMPVASTADYEVLLIKNATLTGASFVSASTNVESDISATALTGGTIVSVFYLSGSNQGSSVVSANTDYNFDLQLGTSLGGTSDTYTVAARTMSGADDLIASMSYYDLTD